MPVPLTSTGQLLVEDASWRVDASFAPAVLQAALQDVQLPPADRMAILRAAAAAADSTTRS